MFFKSDLSPQWFIPKEGKRVNCNIDSFSTVAKTSMSRYADKLYWTVENVIVNNKSVIKDSQV